MTSIPFEQIKEVAKKLSHREKVELMEEIEASLKAEERPQPIRKPRILGLHAHLGKAWMSDDFRDELPDEFWLGQE